MNAVFSKTVFSGLEACTLTNPLYEAVILPDYGANCIALRDRQTGVSLLREPQGRQALEASAYIYGLPILFPPNRVKDGTFVSWSAAMRLTNTACTTKSASSGSLAGLSVSPFTFQTGSLTSTTSP